MKAGQWLVAFLIPPEPFTSVAAADSDGAGSGAGTDAGPSLPRAGFHHASLDLDSQHGGDLEVEPVPDNSPAPFAIKPLVGMVSNEAAGTVVGLGLNLSSVPTGMVSFDWRYGHRFG